MVLSGFSTTKTGRYEIAEILLKVALKHQKSNQIKSIYEAPFALDGNDMTESLSREPHMVFRSPTQLHIRESDQGREVI